MSAKDDFKDSITMDNVNIQGVTNNGTATAGVAEEGKEKGFTLGKLIKFILIGLGVLLIYDVFFATSGADKAINIVKGACFMDSYGNATSETFGDYFAEGNVGAEEYETAITNVQWSSSLNDTGTNYIVTLTYTEPSNNIKTGQDYYGRANNYTTVKWFVDGTSVECIYFGKEFFDGTSYSHSNSNAQEWISDFMNMGDL